MTGPQRIAYGPSAAQFGELYRPEGVSLGTVVVIHGGFWRAQYDLSLGSPLAADLAARGTPPGTWSTGASAPAAAGRPPCRTSRTASITSPTWTWTPHGW